MKGVILKGAQQIEVKDDLPKPIIKRDEVLIKVKYCGICGSGIESYTTGGMYLPNIIIGHEFSGILEEVGEEVKNLKKGDRVTANPNIPCHECYWCTHYQENMCNISNNGIGTTQNGAMADYLSIKAERVHKLPESISLQTGATVEPLANCVYAVQESGFTIGDNAAVYGAGTIGLFTIQVLKVAGANNIYVLEPVESKHQVAKKLGANNSFPPHKWKKIFRLTDKVGPEHIFDCVGVPDTFMSSMQLVKKGGRITIIGIHVEPFQMKGFMQLMLKNITIRGTFSFNQDVFRTALKLLANKRITSNEIISKVIKINEVPEMFETLSKPAHKEIKVLVELS